jgi:polysaccharide biosynthesis/export protein
VISLNYPEKLRNTPDDLELEDGDSLLVPPLLENVQVVGAVFNQTSFRFKEGKDSSYYIDMCGGYTKSADKGNVYVLKVDGRAIKPKGSLLWDVSSHKWDYGFAHLEPGDAVVVPDQLEKTPWLRNIKDVTQIVANVATAAGIAFIGLLQ